MFYARDGYFHPPKIFGTNPSYNLTKRLPFAALTELTMKGVEYMRRTKRQSRFAPFAAGLISGYAAALAICAAAALLLSFTDMASTAAGAAALLAAAAGSFVSGRTAGILRKRGGLKTGALCGVIFILPLTVLSAVFGMMGGFMLVVKALLCVCFAAAGGVSGVNREEKIR